MKKCLSTRNGEISQIFKKDSCRRLYIAFGDFNLSIAYPVIQVEIYCRTTSYIGIFDVNMVAGAFHVENPVQRIRPGRMINALLLRKRRRALCRGSLRGAEREIKFT